MYRNLRRKDREMDQESAIRLLTEGEYAILSTTDVEGQPYGVPLNYCYLNNHLYFHCALEGHKLDNIRSNNKVSFCVVGKTRVLAEKFSTEFESVVVFGKANIVEGEEKYKALIGLIEKYSPEFLAEGKEYIARYDARTAVVKIMIEHLSGKARR
ncbi:MAG: pyridoxamine 5'-phosphate oxidase family protein [Thermodesulfobacteriota bacterium]